MKLKDFVFKLFFGLWNPKNKMDSTGKIIDDFKRKKHIREISKKIKSGEINLPDRKGDAPRCYKVRKDGQIIVTK